jgi:hypothetical protein
MPPLKIVTGGLRIRSGIFAEDVDHEPILAPNRHALTTRFSSTTDRQSTGSQSASSAVRIAIVCGFASHRLRFASYWFAIRMR